MKKVLSILLLIATCSCSKIICSTNNLYNGNNYVDNKYIFEDKTLIAFNGGFYSENERVKVSTKDKIYLDEILKTNDKIGLAKGINVDQSETIVYFYSIDKSVKLKEAYMKKYKFVNINKRDDKYYIEYTNKKKSYH